MPTAARKDSFAYYKRIVCRCKDIFSSNRCSYKKQQKECTIYYHKGTRDCGRLARGPEFGNYAIILRLDKGKDRE